MPLSKPALTQTSNWQQLSTSSSSVSDPWDIIVIGGGITGAGVYRQAAQAGYKALLIEQKDFAWGTSSRSSKMVHGGFRYIAQGDIKLTNEALIEREQMLKEVPGLVDRTHFLFPLRKGQFPGRFIMGMLLKVYDMLAGVKDSDYIKNEALADTVPGIDAKNMKGAISYSDATTDDSRLVMRVIQEGTGFGGLALNYVKANEVLRDEDTGAVCGLKISNEENGESLNISARALVNATGAWADDLMNAKGEEKKIRPLRGSHLVLEADKFPLTQALTLIHPKDGRPIFMFPWYGRVVLGTTDLDYPEDLNFEAAITDTELDYLLDVAKAFFPKSNANRNDVVSTFSGVRPVISSGKGLAPSQEKRGHSIWKDEGLISVSGGKLTIWRVIANEVMEEVANYLDKSVVTQQELMFNPNPANNSLAASLNLRAEYRSNIIGRLGDRSAEFFSEFDESYYKEIENYCFSLAECLWAIKYESVVHLDDLLLRRTRLGLLDRDPAILQESKSVLMEHLSWSDEKWDAELVRFKQIKDKYYST